MNNVFDIQLEWCPIIPAKNSLMIIIQQSLRSNFSWYLVIFHIIMILAESTLVRPTTTN